MVHHVYRVKENCLVRFSLLPSGAIKKAQVLGGKLRFMAFEWTHLACQQAVYERMVESMTVKIPHPESAENLKKQVIKKYGSHGISGWFNRNSPRADLINQYGEPQEAGDGFLKWKMRIGDYHYHLKAAVKDDKFLHFYGTGLDRFDKPIGDTVSWVKEKLQDANEGDDDHPAKDMDLDRYLKIMIAKAPTNESSDGERSQWYRIADDLIKHTGDPKPFLRIFNQTMKGSWFELSLLEHATISQKKDWYTLVIANLWEKDLNGIPAYESLKSSEVAYLLGDLHEFDTPMADKLLKDLNENQSQETTLIRLGLLNSWDTTKHEKEVLARLATLQKKIAQRDLETIFRHLYGDGPLGGNINFDKPGQVALEIEKLTKKLEGRNLKWGQAIIEKLQDE